MSGLGYVRSLSLGRFAMHDPWILQIERNCPYVGGYVYKVRQDNGWLSFDLCHQLELATKFDTCMAAEWMATRCGNGRVKVVQLSKAIAELVR